jgi:hypothetical protein
MSVEAWKRAIKVAVTKVAQICNLLYRRIAFCHSPKTLTVSRYRKPADCKSAIQQIENLRYGQDSGRHS